MASFRTNKGIKQGVVVRENDKTIVIKLEDGKYIKRHKQKHDVVKD